MSAADYPTPSEGGLTPEELAAQRAAELPDREAMSLISTDPSASLLTGYEDSTDNLGLTGVPTTDGSSDATGGAMSGATGIAGDATDTGTDAAAGETESGSVTSTDRSEQFSAADSATATS